MKTNKTRYWLATGIALVTAFILVWLSLGVGIIGRDGDPANVMYFGVLGVGILGSFIARFQPRGMSHALIAMALAQTLITGIALIAGLGAPWSGRLELSLLNGFFITMFLIAAWLFYGPASERLER